MSTKVASPRQAFFAQFAKKARECLKTDFSADVKLPLILLTGGLRSPAHLQSALDAGHADLLGIGRGSVLRPDLPAVLQERILKAAASDTSIALDDEPLAHQPDDDLQPRWIPRVPLVGAGLSEAWYNVRIRWIAASQLEKRAGGTSVHALLPTFGMSGIEALVRMWVWLEWHEIFIGALSVCCVPVVLICMITGF